MGISGCKGKEQPHPKSAPNVGAPTAVWQSRAIRHLDHLCQQQQNNTQQLQPLPRPQAAASPAPSAGGIRLQRLSPSAASALIVRQPKAPTCLRPGGPGQYKTEMHRGYSNQQRQASRGQQQGAPSGSIFKTTVVPGGDVSNTGPPGSTITRP